MWLLFTPTVRAKERHKSTSYFLTHNVPVLHATSVTEYSGYHPCNNNLFVLQHYCNVEYVTAHNGVYSTVLCHLYIWSTSFLIDLLRSELLYSVLNVLFRSELSYLVLNWCIMFWIDLINSELITSVWSDFLSFWIDLLGSELGYFGSELIYFALKWFTMFWFDLLSFVLNWFT